MIMIMNENKEKKLRYLLNCLFTENHYRGWGVEGGGLMWLVLEI